VEEKVVAYFVVLYQHLPEVTDDSQEKTRKKYYSGQSLSGPKLEKINPVNANNKFYHLGEISRCNNFLQIDRETGRQTGRPAYRLTGLTDRQLGRQTHRRGGKAVLERNVLSSLDRRSLHHRKGPNPPVCIN
jgi:hypothetical protein